MDRNKNATDFFYGFNRLKESEKLEFSRLCNKLLSNCLMTLKKEKDRTDFYTILSHLQIYQNYFSLMDYELNHYDKDQVLHLINLQNYNHYSLKKNESIVILVLRKLYYLKMQEIAIMDDVTISFEELHEEILRTGLFDKRLNKGELQDILRIMKRFSLIDVIGGYDQDNSTLILYPTLLYAVPYQKIEEIEQRLKTYEKGGETDATIEEDTFD